MEWKTIDSAPKDGRYILGWVSKYQFPVICNWCGYFEWKSNESEKVQLTHWAEIPEPPSKGE